MNLRKLSAWVVDAAMCAGMFAFQRRHRLNAGSRDALVQYIHEHRESSRSEYFGAPLLATDAGPFANELRWSSPIVTSFRENNTVHVDLFPCAAEWSAPTLIFLHALMSASDSGYRKWAARFNAAGWNACFIHLPFHYSRKPAGHGNGELAITADLVRTAEGLRQGVTELRQLMAALRLRGCTEFALWASSYGAWIGALLASVEPDFRWLGLMEPIVDIDHAIWTSPAAAALRRQLHMHQIEPALVSQHFHLTSPMHGLPLCGCERAVIVGGEWDHIARMEDVERFHQHWAGSELLRVKQGHFGYRMMPALWAHLEGRGLLDPSSRNASAPIAATSKF